MNRLKRTLVLVVVLCFIPATNVYADKMKHRITTIDDVKEFRTLVIKRMNTKLESDNTNNIPRVTDIMVKELENIIDKYEQEVGVIQYFILPGGSKEASFLHLARCIARRAERNCVELSTKEKINHEIIPYINRLSDLLFMLARVVNKRLNIDDIAWHN